MADEAASGVDGDELGSDDALLAAAAAAAAATAATTDDSNDAALRLELSNDTKYWI